MFFCFKDQREHHWSQLCSKRQDQFDECCPECRLFGGGEGANFQLCDNGGGQGRAWGNSSGSTLCQLRNNKWRKFNQQIGVFFTQKTSR